MTFNSSGNQSMENKVGYQLLDDLGYSKSAVEERIHINSVSSEAMTLTAHQLFGSDVDKIIVGSKKEGISLFGESDADIMTVLQNIVATEDPTVGDHHGSEVFAMETEGVPTGYTMLRLLNETEVPPSIADFLEEYNSAQYLSSNKIMTEDTERFRLRGGWRESAVLQAERRGPSIPESLESDDIYSRFYDYVTGDNELINKDTDTVQVIPLECPAILQAWVNRPRPYNWPTQEMIGQFSQLPVHVVPVGRSDSAREDLQWRISFTMGEIYLVQQFNDTQIKMLVLMRIIAKGILKPISRKFSSYLFKNVALWLSEELPHESFQAEFMLSRIQDGLQYLLRSIQKKELPCYMIPGRNLLHSLHDDEAFEAEAALEMFLVDYHKNVMNIVTDISKDSSQLRRLSQYDMACRSGFGNIRPEDLVKLEVRSANCSTSYHQHWVNMSVMLASFRNRTEFYLDLVFSNPFILWGTTLYTSIWILSSIYMLALELDSEDQDIFLIGGLCYILISLYINNYRYNNLGNLRHFLADFRQFLADLRHFSLSKIVDWFRITEPRMFILRSNVSHRSWTPFNILYVLHVLHVSILCCIIGYMQQYFYGESRLLQVGRFYSFMSLLYCYIASI